jgi:hypothetical protein
MQARRVGGVPPFRVCAGGLEERTEELSEICTVLP